VVLISYAVIDRIAHAMKDPLRPNVTVVRRVAYSEGAKDHEPAVGRGGSTLGGTVPETVPIAAGYAGWVGDAGGEVGGDVSGVVSVGLGFGFALVSVGFGVGLS
jgi:hypothetical protein